jgi:hypothetical protein
MILRESMLGEGCLTERLVISKKQQRSRWKEEVKSEDLWDTKINSNFTREKPSISKHEIMRIKVMLIFTYLLIWFKEILMYNINLRLLHNTLWR